MSEEDVVKKPHTKSAYTEDNVEELYRCIEDPIYFMRNFVKIQHPMKGAQPFHLYPFQYDIVKAFHDNRFSIALTARQMGKCIFKDSLITKDGEPVKIQTLINLKFKDRIVDYIEGIVIKLKR